MPAQIANITKPFKNPSEVLEAVFNAMRQPKRLRVIEGRIDADSSVLEKFEERDIVHLILMSLAEQSGDSEISNEELQAYMESLADEPSEGTIADDAFDSEDFDLEKYLISENELEEKINDLSYQAKLHCAYAAFIREQARTLYPQVDFLFSTNWWWSFLPYLGEIDLAYKEKNPLSVLCNFFSIFFYGQDRRCPLNGGPIPRDSSLILRSLVRKVCGLSRRKLSDSNFHLLCDAALGDRHLAELEFLNGLVLTDQTRIPEPIAGPRFLLVMEAIRNFISQLPSCIPEGEKWQDDITVISNKVGKAVGTVRDLLRLAKWYFEQKGSIYNYNENATFSLLEAIQNKKKLLIFNISGLVDASTEHLRNVRKADLTTDADNGQEPSAEDINKDIWKALNLLAPLMALEELDTLRCELMDFAINSPQAVAGIKLGSLSYNADYWVNIRLQSCEKQKKHHSFELASLIFSESEGRAFQFEGPVETMTGRVLECVNLFSDMKLFSVAASLLAAWIEMQAVVHKKKIPHPFDVIKAIEVIPEGYRDVLYISLHRASAAGNLNSVFIGALPLGVKVVPITSEDQIREYLGEAWDYLSDDERHELLEAEAAWVRLKSSENEKSVSFRAPFVHWGPVLEGRIKKAIKPLIKLLADYPDEKLRDNKYEHLRKVRSGHASLFELVNLIANYKKQFSPQKDFVDIISWIEEAPIKQIIEDNSARFQLKVISEKRNLAVHDGVEKIIFEDVLLVYLYLFKNGLLKRLILAAPL